MDRTISKSEYYAARRHLNTVDKQGGIPIDPAYFKAELTVTRYQVQQLYRIVNEMRGVSK
jgi:hypothetical protein